MGKSIDWVIRYPTASSSTATSGRVLVPVCARSQSSWSYADLGSGKVYQFWFPSARAPSRAGLAPTLVRALRFFFFEQKGSRVCRTGRGGTQTRRQQERCGACRSVRDGIVGRGALNRAVWCARTALSGGNGARKPISGSDN